MRVLVVEDEALLAAEIEFILDDAGFEPVGVALNRDEALDILRRERPDLALVDVHLLDGPTGVDVVRAAVEEHGIVAVFMTANRKRVPEDFAGACGVIAKPYTEWGMKSALAFVKGCLRDGAATKPAPISLDLAPEWSARWRVPDAAINEAAAI